MTTPTQIKKAYLSFDVGTVNLACCLLDEDQNILMWHIMDISAATYDKQCENLIRELDKIEYEKLDKSYDITIVIERQPCKNPKMRIISGQIQMYFALEKYYFKRSSETGDSAQTVISKVVYYSPKHKLRCYSKQPGDLDIVEKKYKSSYTFRKNLAKQHCSIMIRRSNPKQDQKFIDLYDKNKAKQDDLADSYLQGISYIMGF